ncbi:S-methyl-5'-thioinosine phosphorylase [Luteimonas sp. 50]|uniref:Probable 6-oxopurine nucleoside phosphorylase n=1 Tax=Cognatiluteimonas sedimenti TaxID=2927791 RepID=A0ABT0A093_9GAMM|nr:S-methyl-5'-thioinosine phosphorylase [Lysobacter sedimenti]MCJ0824394.1 S-methyl-5'-thioinosine phosphorylase [Lysobacter sedimenti]
MSPTHPAIDLAVIGGTGVYALAELADVETVATATRYGAPSGPIRIGTLAGHRVAFLARHGEGHSVPPHRINYRANLAALQQAGAARVLALNTVGGIDAAYAPRALGCPDQLIDYTWGRVSTLCEGDVDDGGGNAVLHVDFGDPYTPSLRAQLLAAARGAGVALVDGGCYGATQGPRLETKAEILRMRRDGCDLVGMTGMPEAGLARELGLEYACLAIVANWAAGAGPDPDEVITLDEVLANVAAASAGVSRLLAALLAG